MLSIQFSFDSHRIGPRLAQAFCALTAVWLGLFARSAPAAVTLTVGTNINITKSSGNNAEETIAINPLNPNNLFVDDTWSNIGKYSTNGGATWQNSNLSALGSTIGDCSASWDKFGNLFLTQFGNSESVVVGLSTNGGASFSKVYETLSTGNDQPTIVTGPGPNAGQGSVWISYNDGDQAVQGALVTGLGAVGAFGAVQHPPEPPAISGSFGDIVVGPTGQVMVAYQDPSSGPGPDKIYVNVDPDGLGAAGFGPVITVGNINVGGFAYITPQHNRSVDSEIGLAWDRSGGAHNGRVYLMYTDRASLTVNTNDTDIYVRYSDNNGTTWTLPVRVNDDAAGNGKSQFLPKIALDQTTGNIAVSFYDCRNSSNDTLAEYWLAVSTDGGLTFAPNVKVSAGASNAGAGSGAPGTSGFDYGDYTGIAFNNGIIWPCWSDNSNSTGDNPAGAGNAQDMYTAKITMGGAPVIAGIQPPSLTVLMGQPAAFTVNASGSTPLSYRWRFNGSPIAGATTSVFSLASAQPFNSGGYSVVVTNAFGAATSSVAILTVIPTVPLPFALNDNLNWITNRPSPWYGQTNISHDGVAAAQTFFLADGSQTTLRTTVTGPGTLSFWWKVSSETNADVLSFGYGGTNVVQISGEAGWEQHTYFLPPGSQNLLWTYAKDASGSAGQDAAWVDEVIYTVGGTGPFILTQPTNQISLGGTPAVFAVAANGTPDLSYQWRFNGADIPGATANSFTIGGPLGSDDGDYTVLITNAYGSITSSVAVLAVVPFTVRGDNSFGQLNVPLGATNAIAVAAGAWHTLVLRSDGLVLAWGNDDDGECDVPTNLVGVADIAAGGYHSLALRKNQTVVAWGADYYGQATVPTGITNAIAIAAGTWHSLALRSDGKVVAWGDDAFGQLEIPHGLSNVVAIAAGGTHSLALRANGTVVAWGNDNGAQGDFVGQTVVPPGLGNVVAIGAGAYHSLAIRADGTLAVWGDNSRSQSDPPPNLGSVVAAVGGGGHSLALKPDGTVRAWGNDLQGQGAIPVTLSNVVLIAAGNSHTLVLVAAQPSAPRLLDPARGKQPRFTALLQTYSGRTYALESSPALRPAVWTALSTNHGNGIIQFLIDPAATAPQRFYRVRQW
jgi:hypothetical protein